MDASEAAPVYDTRIPSLGTPDIDSPLSYMSTAGERRAVFNVDEALI